MRLLLLDADSNEGRAIVQSLGARGHELCVAAKDRHHPAFASRYVTRAVVYPDPIVDKAAFQAWIVAFQREHRFALILPANECTLVPLHELRDVEVLRGVVAMPSAAAIEGVLDKENLRRLAVSLGVPTPDNLLVQRPEDLGDPRLDGWLADTAVVVKSVRSKVWGRKGAEELRAHLATSRAEVEAVTRRQLATTPVQLQRWVPGVGVGVELLAREGEIVLSFAHERIHELPLTGGGSSYRRAIPVPPALLEDSARLVRALGWHGVAMVEFRMDPGTGRYWLMEINGRFWGSLPLAIFAGADFPAALVAMLLDGELPGGPPPRDDVYCRHVARDVAWIKAVLRNRGGGRFLLTRPLGASLLEWGRVLTGKETWDGASLRDPGPLLHELYGTFVGELASAARSARRLAGARRSSSSRSASR
jgi:predicted ATP-grasp superfamily ATP-dependent carboligase